VAKKDTNWGPIIIGGLALLALGGGQQDEQGDPVFFPMPIFNFRVDAGELQAHISINQGAIGTVRVSVEGFHSGRGVPIQARLHNLDAPGSPGAASSIRVLGDVAVGAGRQSFLVATGGLDIEASRHGAAITVRAELDELTPDFQSIVRVIAVEDHLIRLPTPPPTVGATTFTDVTMSFS
jgi:hypothetical protein